MGGVKINGLFHLSIEEEFLNPSLSRDEPDSGGGSDRPLALPREAARDQQPGLGEVQRLLHPQHRHGHRQPGQQAPDSGV